MSDTPAPSRVGRLLLVVLIVAVGVIPLKFSTRQVSGGAMLPQLADGSGVVLDIQAYGLSLPVSGRLREGDPPTAGDVVVIVRPSGEQLLKRVVGAAGDRIAIEGQRVTRNGEAITGAFAPCTLPFVRAERCATETIDGRTWQIAVVSPSGDPFTAVTVPPGHVFVLGDHRDQSNDSRSPSIGSVPVSSVVGRVIGVYRTDEDGLGYRALD